KKRVRGCVDWNVHQHRVTRHILAFLAGFAVIVAAILNFGDAARVVTFIELDLVDYYLHFAQYELAVRADGDVRRQANTGRRNARRIRGERELNVLLVGPGQITAASCERD